MIKCDAVVLANGDFPVHAVPLSLLENAVHIVACDGAIAHLTAHEYQADVVAIGDGDSVPDALRDHLIQVDEQEDNDLTKATRYCLQQDWYRIAYLSATGKREDHTLGNISLLMRYFREYGIHGMMFTDYGFFMPVYGHQTFRCFAGQQVSIFNFGCTRIQSERLRWNSYAYEQWWQGTLNEALADTFSIDADGYYMVYQTYE